MDETADMPDGLWTAADVAAHLQVAEGTVNQWVKSRDIPVVKVGRLNRFDPDAIRGWWRERARPVSK